MIRSVSCESESMLRCVGGEGNFARVRGRGGRLERPSRQRSSANSRRCGPHRVASCCTTTTTTTPACHPVPSRRWGAGTNRMCYLLQHTPSHGKAAGPDMLAYIHGHATFDLLNAKDQVLEFAPNRTDLLLFGNSALALAGARCV